MYMHKCPVLQRLADTHATHSEDLLIRPSARKAHPAAPKCPCGTQLRCTAGASWVHSHCATVYIGTLCPSSTLVLAVVHVHVWLHAW